MRGEVVSYVSGKKYGFINGRDGESYFFHASNLMDQREESQLTRGAVVEFESVPTPKGLTAKSISVQPAIMAPQMTGFIMTRSSQPKYGEVIVEVPIKTRFFKDPNEGRQHLKALAGAIGGNAILNLSVIKRTFSSGNYRYSMHSFQANVALVYELSNVSSVAEQRLLEEDFEHNIRVFNERSPGIIAEELRAFKQQTAGVSPRAFFAAVFVAFVMFAVKNILLNHFSSLRVAQNIFTRHGHLCFLHSILHENRLALMPSDCKTLHRYKLSGNPA